MSLRVSCGGYVQKQYKLNKTIKWYCLANPVSLPHFLFWNNKNKETLLFKQQFFFLDLPCSEYFLTANFSEQYCYYYYYCCGEKKILYIFSLPIPCIFFTEKLLSCSFCIFEVLTFGNVV